MCVYFLVFSLQVCTQHYIYLLFLMIFLVVCCVLDVSCCTQPSINLFSCFSGIIKLIFSSILVFHIYVNVLMAWKLKLFKLKQQLVYNIVFSLLKTLLSDWLLSWCCSFSFDMFEGSAKERREAHIIAKWNIGCDNRFTWPHIALRHSSTRSCATLEGFL